MENAATLSLVPSNDAPRSLPPRSRRYGRLDHLVDRLRGRGKVAFDIQVGTARHRVEWPLDLSSYRIMASRYPIPLQISARGHFPEIEVLRSHLTNSDLDLLTYYTCSTGCARYLQNSQDRMDWFFALDYYVDGPSTPPELREEVVRDLLAWTEDRLHRSRIRWVNTLNAALGVVLADIEREGIDTYEILRDTRGYYRGFLREFHAGPSLDDYLANRAFTIGVRPEISYCFAYLGRPLPDRDRGAAERMRELSALLIALQNDALSQRKEENAEEGHAHLRSYFADDRAYVSFLNRTYEEKQAAFMALRPAQPGPLENMWRACYQWICGSLVWHLTSRRYDLGQFDILL